MKDNYEDIINLPRFVSKNRKHMSNYDRAAQFAPFAALNGYSEDINEAGRLTEEFIELGEQERKQLDEKLRIINELIKEKPEVYITYFVPDAYKQGGSYVRDYVKIKRIDFVLRFIQLEDGRKIDLYYINNLEAKFLDLYMNE